MSEVIDHNTLLLRALKIRFFEEKLLSMVHQKKITGTVHTCIGQELIPVTLMKYINPKDFVFSNHRCHGHYLSLFEDFRGLALELMSSEAGICFGLGGSQHINRENFYSSGIQGGMLGVSLGVAFSIKEKLTSQISVSFIGDGTLGEGNVYEVFNIASKWNLPLLIVIEDNKYAQSTSQNQVMAGTIENRCKAFNLSYFHTSTDNLNDLDENCRRVSELVRISRKPCVLHVETYRLSPHSKGDDFRNKDEIEFHKNADKVESFLQVMDKKKIEELRKDIESCFENLPGDNNHSVLKEVEIRENYNLKPYINNLSGHIRKDINQSLVSAFSQNMDLILWGEDVEDPYGGAFKVTQTLSEKFPDRVLNMPISESTIVGMGVGRALYGLPTIVEIMFSDFLALAQDQILNTGTKLTTMFGVGKKIPLIIRCANGPNNGYGATHSQDMSGYYQAVPFLDVFMPSRYTNFENFYSSLLEKRNNIALVFENKKLYSSLSNTVKKELGKCYDLFSYGEAPSVVHNLKAKNIDKDFTIVCTALCMDEVEIALAEMIQEEVWCDVFVPDDLKKLNWLDIEKSLGQTKRLIVVEGSGQRSGWATNIWYKLSQRIMFKGEIISFTPAAIPAHVEKEQELFPTSFKIVQAMREIYECT